jgi:hypothetical protein
MSARRARQSRARDLRGARCIMLAVGTPERSDHPLNERLARILERATGQQVRIDTRGYPAAPTGADNVIGATAYLHVTSESPAIQLAMYPADTLTQA